MSISDRADKFVQKVFRRQAPLELSQAAAPGSPQRAASDILKEIEKRREGLSKLKRGRF